ncbi:28S ribosomal protein S9, mitochondrial [Aplysia californica]|uniref:28S ribosomal protein S9, mitochondrial n=1 Tax=Aplysia californica TaxID=6500 RepID=A0ABM1A839_APLCA|nr:28S ribosomal protein S9, mitochondrial [Aplysia californica]
MASLSPWTRYSLCRSLRYCRSSASSVLFSRDLLRNQNGIAGSGSSRDNCTEAPSPSSSDGKQKASSGKAVTISRAMRAYMERAKAHDDMMKAEVADYEIGKRHLANIMGEDPDSFTQDDVNRAIEYLLPSGLFEKRARPMMKDPYEIFPKKKAAQFGLDGRPYHWLYFTTSPNYYALLYDIAWKMEDLKAEEDRLAEEKDGKPDREKESSDFTLARSEWITHQRLKDLLVENVPEKEYRHFLVLMERLAAHPLAYKMEEFIATYREPIAMQSQTLEVPQIEVDSDGRSFATASGKRKKCAATVRVFKPGSGKVVINGEDLQYFSNFVYRESLLFPLSLTGLVGEVDIEAEVQAQGGPTAQAGAIRLAVSRAVTAFVDESIREDLRLAGMLTEDPRTKERKKPGQEKARKKFTWKKR